MTESLRGRSRIRSIGAASRALELLSLKNAETLKRHVDTVGDESAIGGLDITGVVVDELSDMVLESQKSVDEHRPPWQSVRDTPTIPNESRQVRRARERALNKAMRNASR